MHEYLTAEISAAAVAENLSLLRGRLGPATKLCAVVKSNCYGLGVDLLLETIARGTDALAVAAPVEALRIRELGYAGPLVVLFSPCAYQGRERQEALAELIRGRVTLTVVSAEDLGPIAESALRVGGQADVHIKVDSGMGRSGVAPARAAALAEAIRSVRGLRLTGLYTHFATADETDGRYMREQLRQFREAAESLPGRGELTLHAANSAATIDAPQSYLDMVRCGLAVYGYQPAEPWHGHLAHEWHGRLGHESQGRLAPAASSASSPSSSSSSAPASVASSAAASEETEEHGRDARETHGQDAHATHGRDGHATRSGPLPLRPALRVWGRLLLTKPLPAGAAIGYGRTCTLGRPSVVGLVPIGYADGYFRCLSNRSTMRVRGRDVPVLGRVSMDQTVIDLTDVPGASVGDAVEIISSDPSAPHSVENLARLAETIPYEITCRLGPRARRVLV
jgi:alanine racemase